MYIYIKHYFNYEHIVLNFQPLTYIYNTLFYNIFQRLDFGNIPLTNPFQQRRRPMGKFTNVGSSQRGDLATAQMKACADWRCLKNM